ncbi:MAG: hypothetical protein JO253_05905, partial [Alphaproteobacteria bacterium]|nr:hypothetical protein [Alphaproteobacteria bacterium]
MAGQCAHHAGGGAMEAATSGQEGYTHHGAMDNTTGSTADGKPYADGVMVVAAYREAGQIHL